MGPNEGPSSVTTNGLSPTQAEPLKVDSRVTVLAGPTQTPFVLSPHILETSEFFRALLSDRWSRQDTGGNPQQIRVDCEADLFGKIVRLMQYGSFAALPADMSPDELYRLQREVSFFGVSVPDLPQPVAETSPILDPHRLALVTWQASNYKDISCHCPLKFTEARWLVSLFHCYVFCSQCSYFVSLPGELLLKVLAVAEGTKWQSRMLPEAGPCNKYRNGALACSSVFLGLVQISGLDGWKCLSCGTSSFAVCSEPFHAFCTECHTQVLSRVGVPKSQGLTGKLWLMAEAASRTSTKKIECLSEDGIQPSHYL